MLILSSLAAGVSYLESTDVSDSVDVDSKWVSGEKAVVLRRTTLHSSAEAVVLRRTTLHSSGDANCGERSFGWFGDGCGVVGRSWARLFG